MNHIYVFGNEEIARKFKGTALAHFSFKAERIGNALRMNPNEYEHTWKNSYTPLAEWSSDSSAVIFGSESD